MSKPLFSALLISVSTLALTVFASPASLEVKVAGIQNNAPIPVENAYCRPTAAGKSENGLNRRPPVTWSKGPEGTKSYAIFVIDPDVPADFTDAGKEGKTISKSMKRQDFYHWAQIDIPATAEGFPSGSGNEYPEQQPNLGMPGSNSYNQFKDKPSKSMKESVGYDGMCPPWNDERLHHYLFQVYALDTESLKLKKYFSAKEAFTAMKPHILAKGEVVGTYTLNPALMKQ